MTKPWGVTSLLPLMPYNCGLSATSSQPQDMHNAITGKPRSIQRPGPSIVLVLVLVLVVGCSVAIAACGTSGSKPSDTAGVYGARASPVALSKCMRANGVTNFPDPTMGSGGEGFKGMFQSSDGSTMIVDGTTFAGPALVSAEKICKEYLPGGGGPPPAPTETQKAAAFALSKCMREHGLSDFPDPTPSPPASGGAGEVIGRAGLFYALGPGLSPQSPAFKQAATACGIRLP
jgi:hypothetical protein